jgi:hypothetical protein
MQGGQIGGCRLNTTMGDKRQFVEDINGYEFKERGKQGIVSAPFGSPYGWAIAVLGTDLTMADSEKNAMPVLDGLVLKSTV